MDVEVHDQELGMTILCGLPSKFEQLIVAIDNVADDEKLTLDLVKSCLLQEEQRMSYRRAATKYATDSALLGRPDNVCTGRTVPTRTHCKKRGHTEPRCWETYPHLMPVHKGLKSNTTYADAKEEFYNHDNVVWLVAG